MEVFLYAIPYFAPASTSRQVQDPKIPSIHVNPKAEFIIKLATRDYLSLYPSLTYILNAYFLVNTTEKIKVQKHSLSQNLLKTCIQKYYNNSKVLMNDIEGAALLGQY